MNKHIAKGVSLLENGETEKALKIFELVVEASPIDHQAIYFVGLCHLRLDKISTAILQFNRALELAPNTVNYLSDRAVAKLRIRDQKGSLVDLDRCVELDPNYSYRYSLRGFAKNSFGDTDGAIEDFTRAIELDPSDPITYNNLGLAQEQKGYKMEAEKNFEASDKLAGRTRNRSTDHTIDLSKNESSPKTESDKLKNSFDFWNTVKSVFTDSKQRGEFIKFTGDLLRGKHKI